LTNSHKISLSLRWRDGIDWSPPGGGRPRCLVDFAGEKAPESFAGVLEGVLGQSAGSLTHLDLHRNLLGSDGVRRLSGGMTHCTTLRYLGLVSNAIDPAGAGALPEELAHCRALNHLDFNCKIHNTQFFCVF
jgi:hypothetical protein